MTERNHSLNVWRYGLIATCLLLLGLSGYLFRVKEGYRADLLSEQARHAQDNQSHDRRMSAVEELVIEGDLVPVTDSSAFGRVRVHLPRQGHTALVDISRATPPPPGTAYYLFAGRERDDEPAVPVPHEEFGDLHAVHLEAGDEVIRIYRWPVGEQHPTPLPSADLMAEITLPHQTYGRSKARK